MHSELGFNPQHLKDIYDALVYPRLIEEKMLILLRQGKVSKWFSGIGQEAISVGATLTLDFDEWIFPLHRNLGVFTSRKMPIYKLIRQWQGCADGYSKGRERSFHFGSKEHYICGMISHLGPQLALANGVALAYKLQRIQKCALAFSGEGGTSEGDFHEALNVAAVWDLPVIFLIENNGYGLSTPISEQYRCQHLVDKAAGYGMKGIQMDGNNILEVIKTISEARKYCIENQKPILIEALTFRMRGHEEASGIKYVPKELLDTWAKKDPILQFENYLIDNNILDESALKNIKTNLKKSINHETDLAMMENMNQFDVSTELNDLFVNPSLSNISYHCFAESKVTRKLRFIDAIKEAMEQSLLHYPNLILMGQDIAEYGGSFKATENFVARFGKERIRNTPICESAIVGAALGLSLENYKAIVEMQFSDFVTVAFNQIVNNLAKIYYRWGQKADVVIRMPTGGGVGAGPFHSQSTEAWFTHVPGLKIVYPATPFDAKGLLIAAINDPNPVMYFEHKALYRKIEDTVPEECYEVPIGKAHVISIGSDITIITYGMGVHWALNFQKSNSNISLYILDLRTLAPLDYPAIKNAVQHTGKVLVLHEDNLVGGFGGEIAAWISEHCFTDLDAPVMRCASLDTPIPFNIELEKQYMAESRLAATIEKLSSY
ncbi:MAG: dehydrogenase E1 component subunit alpha/beta [Sediminibacterium sp.]|nr:dehydrogenase E1 component subunit alpha/beta [Sediminibacterium sp.]